MARAKTGSITFEKGAWRLRASIGRDTDGRWRTVSRTIHEPNTRAGRAEAEKALRALVVEADREQHSPATKGSFAELVDRWIAFRRDDWPDGSARHVRHVLDNHVIPTLGAVQLDRLRPADIDALYARLRRKLSAATVRRIHANVHAALAQAVRWQMIPTNPAAIATPPKVGRPAARHLPEAKALRKAIDAAEPWLAMLLRLAAHTGARRGELVALRWSDVDLDAGTVTIWQTKTDRAKVIALGEATAQVLADWRKLLVDDADAIGADPAVWVFPSPRDRDEHISKHTATHAWARLRDDHGLAGVRLHDLRHLVATQLLESVDVRTVAGRLGHSSPSVTLAVYAQPVAARDRRAAELMDDWLDG